MTILAIGDTHGNIKRVTHLMEFYKPDTVVQVGDLPIDGSARSLIMISLVADHFSTNITVVMGNHDDPNVVERLQKCSDGFYRHPQLPRVAIVYGSNTWDHEGLTVTAVSGAASVLSDPYDDIKELPVNPGNLTKTDILFTHETPGWVSTALFGPVSHSTHLSDTVKERVASSQSAIDSVVKDCQPKIHLAGHQHRSFNDGVGNDDIIRVRELNDAFKLLAIAGREGDHVILDCN